MKIINIYHYSIISNFFLTCQLQGSLLSICMHWNESVPQEPTNWVPRGNDWTSIARPKSKRHTPRPLIDE